MDEIWLEQQEDDSLAECERAHYEDTLAADVAYSEWLNNLENAA